MTGSLGPSDGFHGCHRSSGKKTRRPCQFGRELSRVPKSLPSPRLVEVRVRAGLLSPRSWPFDGLRRGRGTRAPLAPRRWAWRQRTIAKYGHARPDSCLGRAALGGSYGKHGLQGGGGGSDVVITATGVFICRATTRSGRVVRYGFAIYGQRRRPGWRLAGKVTANPIHQVVLSCLVVLWWRC